MAKAERQSLKHTHKVRLIKYPSGYKEFYCVLDKCTYRVRAQLFVGKKSICNSCGKEFEITNYHLNRIVPKCIDCIPRRDSIALASKKKKIEPMAVRGMKVAIQPELLLPSNDSDIAQHLTSELESILYPPRMTNSNTVKEQQQDDEEL